MDLENLVIHLCGDVKTKDSAQPVPLTRLACDVLREWRKGQTRQSPFVFPSPHNLDKAIGTVRTAWKATLRRAGVSYFPIYNLRHVFCTRLSWVAPDAVVQHAMRHSSPETKRFYQLGLAHHYSDQVRDRHWSVHKKLLAVAKPACIVCLGNWEDPDEFSAFRVVRGLATREDKFRSRGQWKLISATFDLDDGPHETTLVGVRHPSYPGMQIAGLSDFVFGTS